MAHQIPTKIARSRLSFPISFALHLPLWMVPQTGMGLLKKEDALNTNKDYADYLSVIVLMSSQILNLCCLTILLTLFDL